MHTTKRTSCGQERQGENHLPFRLIAVFTEMRIINIMFNVYLKDRLQTEI